MPKTMITICRGRFLPLPCKPAPGCTCAKRRGLARGLPCGACTAAVEAARAAAAAIRAVADR